jgi:ABC-type multidrug transport system fused ATPase/permease subunit
MDLAEGRARDSRRVMRRLWPYFQSFKARLILIGVLLVFATVISVASPYLIGVAVDQFVSPSGAARPAWLSLLAPEGVSRLQGLGIIGMLLLIIYLLNWLLGVLQFRLMVRAAQRALLVMRHDVLQQIQRLSLDFFDSHEAGDLMSRLINDTQVINQMFGQGLLRVVSMAFSLVAIVITMVSLNWRLALASFAVLPIILLVTVIFMRRVRTAYRETRKTIGQVSAELQENIAGVREVQAFARESETMQEFEAVNERNRAANVEAQTLTSAFMPLLDVLMTIALAIVIGFGGYMVLAYNPPLVTIGVIVAFQDYVRRFYQPIRELANLVSQLQSAVAGAERIFDLLDEVPGIVDAPDAIEMPPIAGHIAYDHIVFGYDREEHVLDDVSAVIEPGQMVALVGATGSGKTTMVNLLARFYELQGGGICIDGHDIRTVKQDSLREQIGIVPQDTFLFAGSVLENIRYGRLEASDDEVVTAAKLANAHDFILRLTDGYRTVVGERGTGISHGNRQLLAIARAILKDPRILILDEATSSVDTRTERLIQAALNTLLTQRTSIVIAHRLSTIRNADQILVIQDGHIVERGRHKELLDAGGVYHDLYMSQFRRQEEIEQQIEA